MKICALCDHPTFFYLLLLKLNPKGEEKVGICHVCIEKLRRLIKEDGEGA